MTTCAALIDLKRSRRKDATKVCARPAKTVRLSGLLCSVKIALCAYHRRRMQLAGHWLTAAPEGVEITPGRANGEGWKRE
jgi:hypothetical protein